MLKYKAKRLRLVYLTLINALYRYDAFHPTLVLNGKIRTWSSKYDPLNYGAHMYLEK